MAYLNKITKTNWGLSNVLENFRNTAGEDILPYFTVIINQLYESRGGRIENKKRIVS